MWSAALEGQEVEESAMAMIPVKILTVVRQKPAFICYTVLNAWYMNLTALVIKLKPVYTFWFCPKSLFIPIILNFNFNISGKICLPIVYLQTKKTFCCGLCSCCTLQSVEEHLARALFYASGAPVPFEGSQKELPGSFKAFPQRDE